MSTVQYISTQILANDPTASDNYGYSVAINGTTAVVGAYLWDQKTPTAISGCGAAYVFIKSNNVWTFQQQLLASDPTANDAFGISVAINGDTIVVGAYTWSQKTPTALSGCGAAYVFTRSGTTWTQQAQLLASDPTSGDNFGGQVDISGDTVIVGVYGWDQKTPTSLSNCGSAYIFIRNGTTWTQQQLLLASDPTASDTFGISVGISGDTAVIGARQWDRKTPSAITNCGAAYIFTRSGTTWTQQAQLLASDPTAGDFFGTSVSINEDEDTVLIGAYLWSQKSPAISGCGAAYIFTRSGTTWTQQAQLLASDPTADDNFGTRVAISGSTAIIGLRLWDRKTPSAITNCGAAYIFTQRGTNWIQLIQLLANDPTASDQFGREVAISGDTVVIGANGWSQKTPSSISGCGAAYIYDIVYKLYAFNFAFNETKTTYANIGIGTTSPVRTLDVAGDINFTGSFYNSNNTSNYIWYTNSNYDLYFSSNVGNIGIGLSNPLYLLDVQGNTRATTFIDFSDIRLKENIVDDELSINFIQTLNPKTFIYLNDTNNRIKHGLIAQDLINTGYSNLVDTDNNGFYSLQMSALLGPMVNSLKDLSNKNELLKNKINLLKN